MARTEYAFHADYAKLPRFSLRFEQPLVSAINGFLAFDRWRNGKPRPGMRWSRERIAQPGGASFPVTLMRPADATGPLPAVVYYHGGAFALACSSMHLKSCERYAQEAQCLVAVVDYRLAPRHPFPHGFDDCYRSLEWLRESAAELGVDARRIAVMGDSAGGALSAGVAQKALDAGRPVQAQVLIYPVLDSRCATPSAREFVDTPLWNTPSNDRMWRMYLRGPDTAEPPPYAAPALRAQLSGLPPTYLETAEFDPLRDEGIDYAQRLAQQGVAVQHNPTRGTIHGFEIAPNNPETQRAMRERIAFLRDAFARSI